MSLRAIAKQSISEMLENFEIASVVPPSQ